MSGNDYFPDLHVGRLSVKDNSELSNILNKFTSYNGFFNQKATLVSQKPQEGHTFVKTADEIYDILSFQGYTVDKLYETLGTATTSHITASLNDGRSILSYYSHGAPEGWYWNTGKFDNEDVKSLENVGKYPIVISIACSTGKYDYFSDSFGETLMKVEDKGAIAFIGSTRLAPSSTSRDLGMGIYDAIFSERITEFGPITTSAKVNLLHLWGSEYYSKLVCDLFNVLTDPQLDLSPFPDHELMIELDSPNVVLPQTSTILNVTVSNLGMDYESNVEIQIIIDDEIVLHYTFSEMAGSSSYNISYPWTPIGGKYNVTVYVQPVSGEEYLWNNKISRTIYVIPLSEILVVDDNDGESKDIGTSIVEIEYLLTKLGYDFWIWNETSFGNPPDWFLTYFDLVIWTCGDYYSGAVDPDDALTLERYLNLGGRLLLEGGEIGFDHSSDVFMTRVTHAKYQTDSTGAPGLTLGNFDHAVTYGLPSNILWVNPPSDDGVAPSNLGIAIIEYTGTDWSAVTVFEDDESKVVYCSFPLFALENSTREQLLENSISWLLEPPETLGWIMDISLNSTSSSHERNPSIATDSNGKLYVAYEQYNDDSGLYEIKVSESVDDGITWTRIGGVYDSYNLGNPSIAIDLGDSDNLFVVFEREHSSTDHDIFVLRKVNSSWSVSTVVSDGDDYRYPSITSEYQWGAYDYQYISFELVITDDDRDLMFARSTDDGNTWNTSTIHGGFLDWNVHTQSSIATARGSDGMDYIYIVYKWGAGYNSAYDIVLDRSSDYGNTWTQQWVLDESSRDKNWPVIAVTRGGGTAVIAWHVYYDLDYLNDIQYAWSTENGDSWDTGWLATEAYVNEKTPTLTVDGQDSTSNSTYGRIHIAYWRENEIYYQSATYDSPRIWTHAEAIPDMETYVSSIYTKPAATTYRDSNGRYQPAVVWTSYRNNTYDVYYSTKNVTTLTVEPLTISLNSLKGWEGGTITATGNGAIANTPVYLYWDAISDWNGILGLLNSTTVEADGSYEVTFTVPEVEAGTHYIYVRDSSKRNWNYSTFKVLEPVHLEWNVTLGGSNHDYGSSVQQTADGGYIVTGYTNSFGSGTYDAYLVKTNDRGNETWSKTFGGSESDAGYSVQQTSDGGYIVTGQTGTFGPGNTAVYLIKTDDQGNELWSQTIGGSDYDYGHSVQQTTDGGYIVAGVTSSFTIPVDVEDLREVYLVKTNSEGYLIWNKTYGGPHIDVANSVQQTSDGGYVVAGITYSFGAGSGDFYLVKTDSNGVMLWNRTFGGSGLDDGRHVQQTEDGGYIVSGITQSFGAGGSDVFLVKTDSQGITQWENTFGGTGNDFGYSVQETSDGGYIVTGFTNSFGAGEFDVYLIRTDSDGNMTWSKTIGESGDERSYSVQQTLDGGYIVTGFTNSFGAGEYDVYLVKIAGDDDSPSGAVQLTFDSPHSAIINPAGDVDYYKFSADSKITYTIETSGPTDTYLTLYSTDGATILDEDDDSGEGLNAYLNLTCPSSGTYYVEVSGYGNFETGPYNITIEIIEEDLIIIPIVHTNVTLDGVIQIDEWQDSTNLTFQTNSVFYIKYCTSDNTLYYSLNVLEDTTYHQSDQIYLYLDTNYDAGAIPDEDDYQFQVSRDGDGYVSKYEGGSWTRYNLSWFEWSVISTIDGWSVEAKVPYSGTYDGLIQGIRIRHNDFISDYGYYSGIFPPETSAYVPSSWGKATFVDVSGDDDSPSGAVQLTLNSPHSAIINPAGDVDYYKFSADSEKTYIIETSGSTDTYLTLYSTDGATILDEDDDSGEGLNSYLNWTCPSPGTYYVEISGYGDYETGPYNITISRENHAPTTPSNPSPDEGANQVNTSITLQWSASDPDNDTITFHIYLDTINPPSLVNTSTGSFFKPSGLSAGITYYWKIVADDGFDQTTGNVWNFTTRPEEAQRTPMVSISPRFGAPGSEIIVSGYNFTPMNDVTLYLNGTENGIELVSTTTNSNGSFTTPFTVPAVAFQEYPIYAIDENNVTASETFKVGIIAIIISPTSGYPGTEVTLTGTGFYPGGYNASLGNITVIELGVVSAGETLSDVFTVPALPPDMYRLTVVDGNENELSVMFTVLEHELGIWSVELNTEVSSFNTSTIFGMNDEATRGFDASAGDQVLPPGFAGVESYFYYPDNPSSPADFRKLSTSYHSIGYPSNWTLKIHTFSGTSGNATIVWNSTDINGIPSNYSVTLYTPTGEVDMRTTPSYSWMSEEDSTYYFEILVSAEVEFTLELRAGWNMVSLSVIPEDPSASSVLSGISFYQLVSWSGSGYVTATLFEAGRGYWLLVLEDVNVTVSGAPVDSLSLSLSPGWSMVGGTYDEVQATDVFPEFYQLVTWTGTGYTTATVFEPGKGYWALVLAETQIQLPPT